MLSVLGFAAAAGAAFRLLSSSANASGMKYFPLYLLTFMLVALAFSCSLFLWLIPTGFGRHFIRRSRPRAERLARLLRRAGAAERLPHRALEAELCARPRYPIKRTPRRRAPAAGVLVVDCRTLIDPLPVEQRDLRFEPIDLLHDFRSLGGLLDSSAASGVVTGERLSRQLRRLEHFEHPGWVMTWMLAFSLAMVILAFGLRRGFSLGLVVPLATSLFLGLPSVLSYWSTHRKVWLVPGAIIVANARRGTRQPFAVFRAAESGMLIDRATAEAGNRVQLRSGARRFEFTVFGVQLAALLAGWLSTAPSPTDAEIASFLGEPPTPPSD